MPTIPYVKQTWSEDSSLCNAARNNVHENGIYELSYAPAVRVFHNSNQATVSGTPFVVAFNSERYDQCANAADTMHDTVTNNSRLTCRYAGVYHIAAHWEWNATPVASSAIIRLNGATSIARIVTNTLDYRTQSLATMWSLGVGDYVELVVTQSSGGGINVSAVGSYSPEFMMVRVG